MIFLFILTIILFVTVGVQAAFVIDGVILAIVVIGFGVYVAIVMNEHRKDRKRHERWIQTPEGQDYLERERNFEYEQKHGYSGD